MVDARHESVNLDIDALIANADTQIHDTGIEGLVTVVNGGDVKTVDLESYLKTPRRKSGTTVVRTPEGFDALLHSIENQQQTKLFGDLATGNVTAVLNATASTESPQWEDWAIKFQPLVHGFFKPFLDNNGKEMEQLAFVEFLQNNALAIESPTLAQIEETVLGFESARSSTFASKVNQVNGMVQFVYTEEEKPKGTVEVPRQIVIVCPFIEGGDPKTTLASIRYRINGAKVTFRFEIAMLNVIMQNEYREIFKKIEDLTGRTIIL